MFCRARSRISAESNIFNEDSTVATVSQVSQIPYGMDGVDMAKIEMQFPFQVAFLGINRQHTFVSYAK